MVECVLVRHLVAGSTPVYSAEVYIEYYVLRSIYSNSRTAANRRIYSRHYQVYLKQPENDELQALKDKFTMPYVYYVGPDTLLV